MKLYRVVDKKDLYVSFEDTIDQAFVNALNHCVVEGLMIYKITYYSDGVIVMYIDPDTRAFEYIVITAYYIR